MVDFDENQVWALQLYDTLEKHLTESVLNQLVSEAPPLIDDARNLLFDLTNRNQIINLTLTWLRSTTLVGYHGTRLTDADVSSIRSEGLLPLNTNARRTRLVRALSPHPQWSQVEPCLDETLGQYGTGSKAGCREGQVHLTLSRCGLYRGFNHYLIYGAEVDQHVAYALLGEDGKELLRNDGDARIIRVAVPGSDALNAANRHFTVEERLARRDVPNLVDEFLKVWSYTLAYPNFQCETLEVDCGMVFYSRVPPAWIMDIETVGDLPP